MKTIVLNEPGKFSMTDTPEPAQPGPGEALIKIHRVGICGTDLHAFRGKQPFFNYPRILGHELGVEVVAVGAGVSNVKTGDKCCVQPYLTCGKCIACRRGRTNCCTSLQCLGVHTDGGMREYIVLPVQYLHTSAKMTLEQLALVETLCIGAHAVTRTKVEPQEHVLVIGAGPIGLSVMVFAKSAGAKVMVLDVAPNRLEFCKTQMQVDHAINAKDGDPLEALKKITDGDLCTAVFDATGNKESMCKAFQFASNGARVTYVGLGQFDVSFFDPDFHRKEITLNASRNATAADFKHVMAQIESGKVNTTPWITHRTANTEMIPQFEGWLDPANGCIKAMVAWA